MRESVWQGFKRFDLEFEGMEAIVVCPDKPNGNWLLKTEYFGAFPDFECEMIRRGWHLAYIKNVNRWCLEEDLDRKHRFCIHVSKTFSLKERCMPVGMSCGGMFAVKFAAKYPGDVFALYLDAPVMNLLSCPAGVGGNDSSLMEEFTSSTGMTLTDLLSYRDHPIDKMDKLLKNDIPVIMVYGDSDDVVPYHENGLLLEKYYKANGGMIEVYGKTGCGHHPHSLTDLSPIIAFAEKYCNK